MFKHYIGLPKSRQCKRISFSEYEESKLPGIFYFIHCPTNVSFVCVSVRRLLIAKCECFVCATVHCEHVYMHAYSNSFPVNLRSTDHPNAGPFTISMAMSDVLCYKCVKQEPHQKRMPFTDPIPMCN